jgi:hypothetical protein
LIAVSSVLAFIGLVVLVQAVVWLSAATKDRMHLRTRVGMLLAPVGMALFGLGLLGALVPDFWA